MASLLSVMAVATSDLQIVAQLPRLDERPAGFVGIVDIADIVDVRELINIGPAHLNRIIVHGQILSESLRNGCAADPARQISVYFSIKNSVLFNYNWYTF